MWITNKKPIIALAPMADMTDEPFSRICREVAGSNFVIFREMVSAEAIVRGNEKTFGMCKITPGDHPTILQIFGGNPTHIAEAAKTLFDKFKPDGIDINMGCPVPKIAGKSCAGASLLKDPSRAVKIVKELKGLNLNVPISIKTRLGWNNPEEILEFATRLEEAGLDSLTIHGRTKTQGYSGVADWDMIRRVKEKIKIPLLANGDICSTEDIKKCLEVTGADGVMIGRAALGNPWIFIGKIPTMEERKEVVLRHAHYHIEHYGEKYGLRTFRKHLLMYFKGMPEIKERKMELAKVETIADLENVLEKIK